MAEQGSDRDINEINSPGEIRSVRHAGRSRQVWIYLGKLFRIFIHEKDWKVLPMAALIAWMVAYVVGDNMFVNMEGTKIGSLAFVCCCIWNGFFNSIQSVCRERQILKREHRAGVHISAYLAAHMIYQAFLCACQVAITLVIYRYCGISFPKDGLMTGAFLGDLAITLFLITYASDMLALMVSCIVHTTTSAMTVMPFLLIVQLVFAGVAFPLHGHAALLSNATVSKWGIYAVCTEANYNALPSTFAVRALRTFRDVEAVGEFYESLSEDDQEALEEYTAEYLQVPAYEYQASNVAREWGTLAGFSLLYAAIGMISLELIDRDKR